jgi:predicted amidohydrolase YtcJ
VSKNNVDSILTADSIVTMDGEQPDAEAIAVAGDRILAVGDRRDILAMADGRTRVVDLGNVCVLPGLIEPHTHPDLCAECYAWIDVSGFTHSHVDGVEAALHSAVVDAPAGQWLFAFGLDAMLTENIGSWNRERLDTIAPDNPLAVMIQSMHTMFVNSAALDAAGIDESTPDPPGGGRFQRDQAGILTGKCVEAAAMLPFLQFVDRSPGTIRDGIQQQYRRYARAGLTTIGMPGLFSPLSMLDVFEDIAASDDVPVRNIAYLRHFQIDSLNRSPGDGTDTFRIQGAKLWYDGSPYSGTMLLDEPYLESRLCCCTLGIPSGTVGHANYEPSELRAITEKLHRDGWQVLTHAQGDRGVREALDLYEHALGAHTRLDHRWRLEHCALISPDDLARAARLGVTPSFHINHVYYYGPELRDSIIGKERAERLMPIATALACGHRATLHADSPMYPPEPFKLMQTAVTRRTRDGDVVAPDEAISSEQALRAITLDAAWQLFCDDRIGSIEVGKLADFTVVDQNPLAIEPERLDQIEVIETWLGGRKVI